METQIKEIITKIAAVTLIYALADQQLQASICAAVGKMAARKCCFWLTSRADVCIVNITTLGGEATIAERNNKLYFVALDGGAQTPVLFDPIERNKIKILLRSMGAYAIINVDTGLLNGCAHSASIST